MLIDSPARVIVLNGGSSSGKSGIARCLQAILPQPWLIAAIDGFVNALPPALRESDVGIEFTPGGGGHSGPSSGRWRAPG